MANGEKIPRERELVERLRQSVPTLRTVVLSVNTRMGNSVLGDRFRTLWGPGYIEDELCGLRFRLSPRSFYQVNRDQAERLYETAIRFAELDQTKTVLDLYCGTGTITLCMAKQAGSAIGVEIIDLGASFAEISAQLDKIVSDYFGVEKKV